MGYSSMKKDHTHYLGTIGGLGGKAANNLSKETDTAIAIGTKLADFTTGSWANFENPNFKLVSINAQDLMQINIWHKQLLEMQKFH
jgi:3D-(3,5/4)-trihydroxycyclohexane-1,2-dione acylhydrolase (decyclizing)